MSLDPESWSLGRPAPFDLDDDYRGERRRAEGGTHRAQGGLPWRMPRVSLAKALRVLIAVQTFVVVALLPSAILAVLR